MPARRRKQSNAMLYTLIFVGLSIVSTTFAVIFYLQAENNRSESDQAESTLNDFASQSERNLIEDIVGQKQTNLTWLGAMDDYHNQMVSLILGTVEESETASNNLNTIQNQKETTFSALQEHIDIGDPNSAGLIPIINSLIIELESSKTLYSETEKLLEDKRQELTDRDEEDSNERKRLLAEKDALNEQLTQVEENYKALEESLRQDTNQQVQNLTDQLEMARTNNNTLNNSLLKAQAEIETLEGALQTAKEQLAKIEPGPDNEALAYKPDGKIISIDQKGSVVHINIGINEHVYPGLTFTVYDRGTLIQASGEGKAEIQVFDVTDTYSAARIISDNPKPLLLNDIVANLVWDSSKVNTFVIAGDFDLDEDGITDYDANDRIASLIEKWGGRVEDTISVNTNYLILGNLPQVLERPSQEDQELDPTLLPQYERSRESLNYYNEMKEQAQSLWIPIFTYERFLNFIGYNQMANQAGAF